MRSERGSTRARRLRAESCCATVPRRLIPGAGGPSHCPRTKRRPSFVANAGRKAPTPGHVCVGGQDRHRVLAAYAWLAGQASSVETASADYWVKLQTREYSLRKGTLQLRLCLRRTCRPSGRPDRPRASGYKSFFSTRAYEVCAGLVTFVQEPRYLEREGTYRKCHCPH